MKNVAGFRIDQKAELAVKNRVNSEYILIPETGQPLTVLCIWDFPYPDCSDKFEMLSLQKDGFKSLCSENLGVNKREWEKEKKQFMLKVSRNCGSEEDKAVININ